MTVGLNCFSRGALNGAEQREDGTLESQFGPDSRDGVASQAHSDFLVHLSSLWHCYDTQTTLVALRLKPPLSFYGFNDLLPNAVSRAIRVHRDRA